jgi:hypothetical protein
MTIFPALAPDMEQVATGDSASLTISTGTVKEQCRPTSDHCYDPHMLESRHKGRHEVAIAFRVAIYERLNRNSAGPNMPEM